MPRPSRGCHNAGLSSMRGSVVLRQPLARGHSRLVATSSRRRASEVVSMLLVRIAANEQPSCVRAPKQTNLTDVLAAIILNSGGAPEAA